LRVFGQGLQQKNWFLYIQDSEYLFGIEKFLGELLFQHINSLIRAKVTAKNVLPGDKAVGKH
jgi:hypothetical protein